MKKDNRKFVRKSVTIPTNLGQITIKQLNEKYDRLVEYLEKKYENVHNITIGCETGNYVDGEFFENIVMHYSRLETEKEFEDRVESQRAKATEKLRQVRKFLEENREEVMEVLKTIL